MNNGNGNKKSSSPLSEQGIRWAAIAGLWEFNGSSAAYSGPTAETGLTYGIAVTNRILADGTARIKVNLSEVDHTGQIAAGILLGYHSEQSRYVVAQLGGYGRAYSLAEYVPGFGWRGIENVGSAKNLQEAREYDVEVRQTGQEVRMIVDDVPVIEKLLPEPLHGNQLGLFAWGRQRVEFSDLIISNSQPQVFVAMQFGEPFDTLYHTVIYPQVTDLGLQAIRIDEIAKPGVIFEDIKRHIGEAKVVIAEITAPNQNVFYELGYAHALQKPTILLAQRGKELPFDIRSYRVIFYDDSIGGKPSLERNLQKHLHSILGDT